MLSTLSCPYVLIWMSKPLEKSKILNGFSESLKFALYPYEKTLKLERLSSWRIHAGQKSSGRRSHDHVLIEEPPRPWTNITSASYSEFPWIRLSPKISSASPLVVVDVLKATEGEEPDGTIASLETAELLQLSS